MEVYKDDNEAERTANAGISGLRRKFTERPFGAHVSGTAPKSSRDFIASLAVVLLSLGLDSSEQHPNKSAFSTCNFMDFRIAIGVKKFLGLA